MTGKPVFNPSTFRERQGIVVPVFIWLVLSPLASMAGPFDTYEELSTWPRLAYWAAVVGISVLLDVGYRWLWRGRPLPLRIAGRLGYAVVLAVLLHALNMAVFSDWMGWRAWLWLVGVVWVIAIAIEGLVVLARLVHGTDAPEPQPAPATDETFMRRLPVEKRGALVRLEAQDHYLKVVTQAGDALILMRLSDAEAELSDYDGLRVHRSHWVARDQVEQVVRKDGRLLLLMSDRTEVPVSRTYRPSVDAAGLAP